jgi:hypothetical protein
MQFDRITYDTNRMNRQPCIRNLQIPVKRVMVALYPDRKVIFEEYLSSRTRTLLKRCLTLPQSWTEVSSI